MLTNVMFTTSTIADLARALISSTILMINSFLLKAIVWMCLFPTHVGIPPRDSASSSGPPIVVASIVVVLAAFFVIVARIVLVRISSCLCRRRRHRKKQEESFTVLAEKKKSMVIPPITITCRHRSDCRCLCRPQQNRFVIPQVPAGFKRVLVPTPGAKCGAREYIIAHDLQRQHPPRPHCSVNKPLRPKKSSSILHPTALDAIPEVPAGFTRVLVPVPGTKCGERDYVVVQEKNGGELLDQDGDVVMTTTTDDPPPAAEDPKKNQTSRRIGMREKVLPFELHEQIIEHSYDHMNWTMSLMREYPPEFFLYAREITRKYNFFHGMEGDCASRLGCYIWTIAEEECSMENLESLDESFPTVEHHGVVLEEGREDDDSSLAGSDTLVAEYDEQEDDVVCDAVTAVATTTRIVSSKPSGHPEDGTHDDVFAAVSSCNDGDLLLSIGVKNHHVAMLQQEGSGYYVDDKGRKRRFSLRILAKKNQQGG